MGVQQGAVLSPLLFSLFLNDLEIELGRAPFQGVKLGTRSFNSLLYADDLIFLSDTIEGLQLLMKRFKSFCNKWRLTVNVNKTKVIIFNNDLSRAKNVVNTFSINRDSIEVVDSYLYLGVIFQTSGSFKLAKKNLVKKANEAAYSIRKKTLPMSYPLQYF